MSTMTKSYLHLFVAFSLMLLLTGCYKDELSMQGEATSDNDLPVEFEIGIAEDVGTRGILNESKKEFTSGELIHVRAEFSCEDRQSGESWKVNKYTMLQCSYTTSSSNGGHYNVTWNTKSGAEQLKWPNQATSASFTAYYIAGSTDRLSGNAMQPILLSEYKTVEIPLFAEVKDARYGDAIRLDMTRIFSFLTLTDIQAGVSDNMWFSLPEGQRGKLHNAFQLLFDENTFEMKQNFVTIPDQSYKDVDGSGLAYVKEHKLEPLKDGETDDGSAVGICFFLEPGVYTQFCILYPRTRDKYSTYLSYDKNLQEVLKDPETNPEGKFLPNGRYVFSVLRSLGVVVHEKPEDGWDNSDPKAVIDVEAFLRAAEAGTKYTEPDPDTGEEVLFLEPIEGGTRLVCNVSFQYEYYEAFGDDKWRPSLHNIFDGDYHYIYHVACPVFFENYGTITNVGFRSIETKKPILSQQPLTHPEGLEMSHNGIISMRNMPDGLIDNVRVIDADITVQILTHDNYEVATQEAHDVSLLVGQNQGRIYDIGLAGELNLTVENAEGETYIPRMTIGGIAGQNSGVIRGLTYITDEKEPTLTMPVITLYNKCQGDNGAYWVGGLVGNNYGNLEDLFVPEVNVDASGSRGAVSYLGGITGECPSSSSGAPSISGCMVRGSVKAGTVGTLANVLSYSYTGAVSGAWNIQSNLSDSSVSVDVVDESTVDDDTEYAQGGVFGIIQPIPIGTGFQDGAINGLTCFSEKLKGNGIIGNFAGIVPYGYGWDEYWKDSDIHVKQYGYDIIGLVKEN